jgi:3',5'-cyclic AMP phosphodiesterase CpdA
MPISLLPTNRRSFLAGTLAGSIALASGAFGANQATDDATFALLADAHIPSDPNTVAREVNMAENLRRVVGQLIDQERQPAAALIVGDCAYLEGKVGDYKVLRELLAPLGQAGLPVHLALGNHDHRRNCLEAFPANDGQLQAKVERRVTIIPGKQANWFVLDSLDKVNKTPGELGQQQLKWLAEALDAHADRPALIALHHNPVLTQEHTSGLMDSAALLEVAAARKQVKAIFFGHTHVWSHTQHEGIHLVNLPPVAYVFAKEKPNGWVQCKLGDSGAELKLVCHDTKHPQHGEVVSLAWRS